MYQTLGMVMASAGALSIQWKGNDPHLLGVALVLLGVGLVLAPFWTMSVRDQTYSI